MVFSGRTWINFAQKPEESNLPSPSPTTLYNLGVMNVDTINEFSTLKFI